MQEKVVNFFMLKIKNKNSNLDEIKLEEIRYGLFGPYDAWNGWYRNIPSYST